MKKQLSILFSSLALIAAVNISAAEPVKKGELYTTAVTTQGDNSIVTPRNSQTKEEVVAEFGEPDNKVEAVGEPPISQWQYSKFNVYFEHNLVLHTVLKK